MYICVVTKVFCLSASQLGLFQALGILGHDKMVDAVLYLSVHEGWQIIYGVAYAMVGDASLRIIVGANFGRAVAGGNECFPTARNVFHIFFVLVVVNKSAQSS